MTIHEHPLSGEGPTMDSLLERAFLFLEDGNWSAADEYCEKVLDIDPKNAKAYLGKLMAEMRTTTQEALRDSAMSFENNSNYQKILRFGDDALKVELQEYLACISERIATARKDALYGEAVSRINGNTVAELNEAIRILEQIPEWKDSAEKIEYCRGLIKEFERAKVFKTWKWKKTADKVNKVFVAVSAAAAVLAVCLLIFFVLIPAFKYSKAEDLMQQGEYMEAARILSKIRYFGGAEEQLTECRKRIAISGSIAAGNTYTVALKADGTVVAAGNNDYVSDWKNIVSVAGSSGYTFGLKANGKVVMAPEFDDADDWTDIIAIDFGYEHVVGLREDGTVVAAGDEYLNECDVDDWTDIVAIAAGSCFTVGLKADGTVEVVGQFDVDDSRWTDIVAIAAGWDFVVALKADGTVVAVGFDVDISRIVRDWTDIVAIAAGSYHVVGLKADGTVVTAGRKDEGQRSVGKWTDIVAIAAGSYHTVGLKSDGTVVAVGSNDYGQCNVKKWTNIRVPER